MYQWPEKGLVGVGGVFHRCTYKDCKWAPEGNGFVVDCPGVMRLECECEEGRRQASQKKHCVC